MNRIVTTLYSAGLMNNKARAPQTKEEWEKRQSYIRKVHDPETGRCRLVFLDQAYECVSI